MLVMEKLKFNANIPAHVERRRATEKSNKTSLFCPYYLENMVANYRIRIYASLNKTLQGRRGGRAFQMYIIKIPEP